MRMPAWFVTGSCIVMLSLVGGPLAAANILPAATDEGPGSLEALRERLTVAAWDPDAAACSLTIGRLGEAATEQECAPAGSRAAGAPAASLSETGRVDTTQWFPDIRTRADGSFVRVHGYGAVAAVAADGTIAWRRPAASFYDDWGLTPYVVPVVTIGVSPLDPQTVATESAWSVGDVTGDGVEDVAVGHLVTTEEQGPAGAIYEELRSFVTLLDGADGATLWHRVFPRYVTHALLAGDVLLVGNETGDRTGTDFVTGEDGSRTSVQAFEVAPSAGGVEVTPAWTFDTGVQRERLLAIEPVGEGLVALARRSGVNVLDTASGETRWTVAIAGDPRLLRYDAGRDLVVVQELLAPDADGLLSYALRGFRVADGQEAIAVLRHPAIMLSFDVADVTGGPEAEWIVGDVLQMKEKPSNVSSDTYAAARVEAVDPATGQAIWSHAVETGDDLVAGRTGGTSVPLFYGVRAVGDVVVASWFGVGANGVAGLGGTTGEMLWEDYGPDAAYPVFLEPAQVDGRPVVLVGTPHQLVRALAADTGAVLTEAPALAEILAVVDVDVNGDGVTDLVVGSESGGVFALDGGDLDRRLWQAVASGPVHQLELSDLDGDDQPEIVAAAHRGVDVLRLDGSTAYTVARPDPDLVWTVALGDLDGDGLDDLVIPTRSLSAWRGANGAALWEFLPPVHRTLETRFSTAAITPEGRVVTQFLKRAVVGTNPVNPRGERHLVGLDGETGEVEWLKPDVDVIGIPRLWHSVTEVPGEGTGSAAVALTWDEQVGTGTGLWRPVTDIVDSATGEIIRSVSLQEGQIHMGTEILEPYGLMVYSWTRVSRLAPGALVETNFGSSTWGVAAADTPDGEVFVRGRSGVHVYDAAAPLGGGDADPPLASWDDLYTGRVHASDLDGDGSDELVAYSFDWNAYIDVGFWEGTGTTVVERSFHGLAVLDLG